MKSFALSAVALAIFGAVPVMADDSALALSTVTVSATTSGGGSTGTTRCPTATATGAGCKSCTVPACLQFSTLTVNFNCDCPTAIPTSTLNCENGCGNLGCSTSYVIIDGLVGCISRTSYSSSAKPTHPPVIPTGNSTTSAHPSKTSTSTRVTVNAGARPRPFGGLF